MSSRPSQPGLRPVQWLLTETVRRIEEAHDGPSTDDAATRRARRTGENLTERLAERARMHELGLDMAPRVQSAVRGLRWAFVVIVVLGLLLGAAASRAQLAGDAVIALSWALLTLLAFPLAMLALWLALWLGPRSGSPGIPGRALWLSASGLARRLLGSRHGRHLAASLADFGRQRGGALASAATHAFWCAFFVGAIGMLWAAFIGLRFDFEWGSTLVDPATLADWIGAIGAVPALLPGIDAPSPAQIEALLGDRSGPADRRTWAAYLLSALVVLGLLPRLLLATGFLIAQRRVVLPLDLAQRGYLALAPALRPDTARSLGPRGAKPPGREPARRSRRAGPGKGEPVAFALELESEPATWPDFAPDARLLGPADARAERRALEVGLRSGSTRPERIIALCSMARTPDRGTGAWLAELDAIAPVQIRLVEHELLERRGDDPSTRRADWERLAEDYGLETPEDL